MRREILSQIEEACEERMELLISQMSTQEGVTEALKAADQMEWVRRMNSIRYSAEEIVLHKHVYVSQKVQEPNMRGQEIALLSSFSQSRIHTIP